jgi:hypothetical protein
MEKWCPIPKIVGVIGYVVLPNPYGMGVTDLQVCRNCKKSRFLWTYIWKGVKISLDIKDNV